MASNIEAPPVWVDSDSDEESSSSPQLKRRKRFEKLHGTKQSWTSSTTSTASSSSSVSVSSSSSSLSVKRLPSPPRIRHKNKNKTSTVLNFHPSRPNLYVVGDMSGGLRLCQGETVLSNVSIKEIPVRNLQFERYSKGKTVMITGRRPFYYIYDLESQKYLRYDSPMRSSDPKASLETFANSEKYVAFGGNDGVISLCCSRTRRFVRKVRVCMCS